MSVNIPSLYCQEVYDLGKAVEKFNNYIYDNWELFEPNQLRCLYRFLRKHVCKISNLDVDEESDESDLFVSYSQLRFNELNRLYMEKSQQFSHCGKDEIRELCENLLCRLRDFNNWLDSDQGQTSDWWRVYDMFTHLVRNTWWTNNEIMNYIPDNNTENSQNTRPIGEISAEEQQRNRNILAAPSSSSPQGDE